MNKPEILSKPLWWNGVHLDEISDELPGTPVDVVIVGSGFTGSSAALEVARSGRSVVVLETDQLGFGSSTRNFGYIGGGVGRSRHSRHQSGERAEAIARAYPAACKFVMDLLKREAIDAEVRTEGLAILAHTPETYRRLSDEAAIALKSGMNIDIVAQRDMRSSVIASDRFYGAVVDKNARALNPGKYVEGLIQAARKHGAKFVSAAEALALSGGPGAWKIETKKGSITAGQLGLGTNGHSGRLFGFLRKRIVPVVGTVIATEELQPALMQKLFPRMNWFVDTQFGFLCFRPSPDHKRVIFAKAGMPGAFGKDIRPYAARVHREMLATLPELEGRSLEYAWPGSVAVTFDGTPHLGVHEGVHYAAGYNGSGVAMATFLGSFMGKRLCGQREDEVIFEDGAFPTHFLYTGNTWFMPALRILLNHLKLQV